MSASDVLARIGPGFFQQAFVVDDLAAAQEAFTAVAGCPTWATLPVAPLPFTYRGRDVECEIAIALARSGDVQIELLQPISGDGIHAEFLAAKGPGVHHFGFMVDDLDAEMAIAATAGIEECMAGEFGSLRFRYLDTFDELGVYLELVEDPDRMIFGVMPWR